ncbi:MAG: thiol:disulfide interchange protein [Edaphobacter sp.]|jgi:thiol:disulfide interchange protein|nr:thiol:disulfide interchange protein [Edaphobacter sp.]
MLSRLRPHLLPAAALLVIGTSLSIVGCKERKPSQPESVAGPKESNQPVAAVPPASTSAPAPTPAAIPAVKKHLYSETADPKADIAAALKQAAREHKRVILDFGGDWCGDCQVLDIYFHQSPNAELLAKNFVIVHIDIGRMDHNVDIAEKYHVPIKKGVPALAVLDAKGKLLYSQENKEFENMRNMVSESVTEFLNKWKA